MIPHSVRLRTAWDALRTSFWFVPALMGVGGGLVTALSLMLERTANGAPNAVPWFVYVGAPDDARTVVSTLLSSMMTMVSLVFSITIVVLTLAANQFGPRLIRNFMASPQTQLVLGTFIMTIVHCLLALSAIGWRQEDEPLPFFTVSAAIILSLISVGLLVLHIHALARSIMSETVIARVGAELDDTLDTFGRLQDSQPDPEAALPQDFHELARFSGPATTGYIRAIDFDRLVDAARRADVLVGLTFRAGDFVVEDSDAIGIYPGDRAAPELMAAAADAVEVGTDRTPVQDPDFAMRHLVEIAVRALSPGINDPYTAIAAINQLSASLARLMDRNLPDAVLHDREGTIRVLCPRPTYGSLIAVAFDQIRQNGGGKPAVVIHLLQAIERLAPHVRTGDQKHALLEELETIQQTAARAVPDAADRSDIDRRAEAARSALERRRPDRA
jgi:uncharacterized membrane protein